MRIPLCLSRRPNQPRSRNHPPETNPHGAGQILVIFGVALVVLAVFAGLAVDAGMMYVTYGQLKRSLDAAAVAAANNFKRGQNSEEMKLAAVEILHMNNVQISPDELTVYICDGTILDPDHPDDYAPDGTRDAFLQTAAPSFYSRCPNTPTESPRKLVYLEANMHTPFYFLTLVGIHGINLHTDSTAEAAAVDLVLVIDTSESMGTGNVGVEGYTCRNPTPAEAAAGIETCKPNNPVDGCNWADYDDRVHSCTPLIDAKQASIELIQNFLYQGYDQVAVVTFDTYAHTYEIDGVGSNLLSGNLNNAEETIKSIKLHDDPSVYNLPTTWTTMTNNMFGAYNPVNPEDRDGDGRDADPMLVCDDLADGAADGWDATFDMDWPLGHGIPCDDDDKLDVYDWDANHIIDQADYDAAAEYVAANQSFSTLSTCTGCGIRVGANILKEGGRPNSLWVMILLSDGMANLTDTGNDVFNDPFKGDTFNTSTNVPATLPNGYCTGWLNQPFWNTSPGCADTNYTDRYCVDSASATCPLSSTWYSPSRYDNPYSVYDYTRDMADDTALTASGNPNEPRGNDITIFTIGLNVGASSPAESLLRYIANVGEDGNRDNPPSCATQQSCGNYYYAASGSDLGNIFDKIATRIYTRITD